MILKIISALVFISQILTSFSLSVLNTEVYDIDYGGTPYVEPVITEWLTLVDNSESDYVIIKGAGCSASVETAVNELQSYIAQISGKTLAIKDDTAVVSEHEILVGTTNREGENSFAIDREALGDEGFTIKVVGEKLVIAGSDVRGALYGVYTFLENELGCRWFTSEVSTIPDNNTIKIDAILEYTQIPIFEYRHESWESVETDTALRAKLKLKNSSTQVELGGGITYANSGHSMNDLVPMRYFDEHPEYFSYRLDSNTWTDDQRCLTNPKVLAITIENVRATLLAKPDARIADITQNDNSNYCQCESCQASDERYGGPSGTNICFVNQVAAALEDEFPGIDFSTYAYQYTRTPPENIVPRDNVLVRLCSIECCFSHPLEECGATRIKTSEITDDYQNIRFDSPWERKKEVEPTFANDLKTWSAISNKLYARDYTTNFLFYLNLFPNFHTLSPNMQFFAENSVKGVYEQGNSQSISGEFGELRAYIIAKLLWDPYCDVEHHMDEFLNAYYGENSAATIKEYIDIITNKMFNTNHHLYIMQWENETPYFTSKERKLINELWDVAETHANNDTQLKSIQRSRLSWRWHNANQMLDDFSYLRPFKRLDAAKKLYNDIIDLGITHLTEHGGIAQNPNFWASPSEWRND